MAQPQGHFGYEIIRIIKTSSLGVGSYGAVYRALCDELPCAAKVLHPTLFDIHDPGARKIMERFEQECRFLSGVRHPHIVQYLGVSRDPESGLPVLLMELMDSNLTQFLEQSEELLPFHFQVNLCHDIVLALAYLHSNGIIHRDLSSNNVLLIGSGNRAKITDFGMSKLADANPCMTPMTMCPGTPAYMPPEALDISLAYGNKLDCFSFGVLDIQIVTRQFPNPSKHSKTMEIDDPRFPTGRVKVPVPEVERRQSHIDLVDPAHPLLPVALDCLKDIERERPSARELCHRLAALKEVPAYVKSMQQAQRVTTDGERVQIMELQAEAQEKNHTIAARERTIQQLEQRLVAKDQQIRELQQQTNDQPTAKFQVSGQNARKGPPVLNWRSAVAPFKMEKPSSVVDGSMVYFNPYCSKGVCSYDSENHQWSSLPQCPVMLSSLAVVNGLLTAIGGERQQWLSGFTNQLFSLIGEKKWVEHFPPMPTMRRSTAAVCSGKSLVVAGGEKEVPLDSVTKLKTVEVMDTETLQWSTASSLPFPLAYASATICQNHIYLLGYGTTYNGRSVLTCSMVDLLQSCQSHGLTPQVVWRQVAALPVRASSCTTLCGQLLAVGGCDNGFNYCTTAIHQYNTATDSWEIIGHMPTARCNTLVAVLPENELMVVGGNICQIGINSVTDTVEIATDLKNSMQV